jgi:Undecaprenyl-phosphate glucose phosphotransferase
MVARRLRGIDLAMLGAALVFAFSAAGDPWATPLRAATPAIIGAVCVGLMLRAWEAYAFPPVEGLRAHLAKTLLAVLGGAALAMIAAGALGAGGVQTDLWALSSALGLGLVHAGGWSLVRAWRRGGRLTPNIVIVGATANAQRLIETAIASRTVAVLGVFDDRASRIPADIHGVPVLGDIQSLLSHKLLPYIDRIVITVTPAAEARVRTLIDRLKFLPNAVTLFMDAGGIEAQRSALARAAEAPLTAAPGGAEAETRAGAKRAQDVILALLALIPALPLMAMTALAVKLDSPGPVVFRQRRHGFNNEVIEVLKFRSMRADAADPTASRQVSANDERVTRVGRVIRRLSLDELPQLFNVLKGEMSLVGPRPHAIGMKTQGAEAAGFVAEYAWRHRMKPGITGWAQINGSVGALETPEQVRRRVALDVEYIERQSFWFDLYILAMTLPALIGARKAVR